MSKIKKGNLWIPKPQVFADSALETVGLERITNGYWSHNITVSYQYFHFSVKKYKICVAINILNAFSDSARHRSQDICPPISQIVLKNFIKISSIIKECAEEIFIKLAIVLKISKSS